ncbi:hypothetical protein CSC44_4452 [Pseudomonas aeruginosa]|nr:hypothetical protein CSC44_4452 [Pseudomonas aeruginosa]
MFSCSKIEQKQLNTWVSFGWSEVALYFRSTSAATDFEISKPIKNDQITRLFQCFWPPR